MREVVKQSQSELEQTEVTAIATMDNAAPAVLRTQRPQRHHPDGSAAAVILAPATPADDVPGRSPSLLDASVVVGFSTALPGRRTWPTRRATPRDRVPRPAWHEEAR